MDVKPLYLYGDVSMDRLRAAKDALNLPFLVKRVQAGPGTPGIAGRVLAFAVPPFACEYALVRTDAGLVPAMAWACGVSEDRRATTVAQWLSDVMGVTVREL